MLTADRDERCWRYRRAPGGVESQMFSSPHVVPADEGWTDSPARIDAVEVAKPAPQTAKKHSNRKTGV